MKKCMQVAQIIKEQLVALPSHARFYVMKYRRICYHLIQGFTDAPH